MPVYADRYQCQYVEKFICNGQRRVYENIDSRTEVCAFKI